jgi:hypothetical protein
MNTTTTLFPHHIFQTANAQLQVRNGCGRLVKAEELDSLMDEGIAIYHEVWRDHEWLYLNDVSTREDGQIEIEYLTMVNSNGTTPSDDPNVNISWSENRVVKNKALLPPGTEVLIAIEPMARPQGERITNTTTRTVKILLD